MRYTIKDMRELAKAKGGICLSNNYQRGNIKLSWQCKKKHRWRAIPYSIIQGVWCPKCATQHAIQIMANLKRIYLTKKEKKLIVSKYFLEGKSTIQIGKEMGYSGAIIRRALHETGRKLRNPGKKGLYCNVNKEIEGIVIGTLLGDGYFVKQSKTYALGIAHCGRQREYLKWKDQKLERFGIRSYFRKRFDKRTGKIYEEYKIQTRSHPFYNIIYSEFFKGRTKQPTKKLLNYLTKEGIAVWYCDDGNLSLLKTRKCLSIATYSFNKNSIRKIKKMFKDKYNINFREEKSGVIALSSKIEIKKFMKIFGKYIPNCMGYKRVKL